MPVKAVNLMPRKFSIKLFADGADRDSIVNRYQDPLISGFTTNPTLMKKSGITDYEKFAKDVLSVVKDKPISFEVFSDELAEMREQALVIASWGKNVNVKVPITNTRGDSTAPIIRDLSKSGVILNVTAMTTFEQVRLVAPILADGAGGICSVFAGRIADTGVDPLPIMQRCMDLIANLSGVELLWASPREIFNLVQAEQIGCHIITLTEDILKKLPILDKPLEQMSLETVEMFYKDAQSSGFKIALPKATHS